MATCVHDMLSEFSLDFIGLQETVKKDYDQIFSKASPWQQFFWKWVPLIGKSRGILYGVKNDFLDMKKCNWGLIVVYGAAQDELKNDFCTELASFCHNMNFPMLWLEISIS
jgi:hypothetical protein